MCVVYKTNLGLGCVEGEIVFCKGSGSGEMELSEKEETIYQRERERRRAQNFFSSGEKDE